MVLPEVNVESIIILAGRGFEVLREGPELGVLGILSGALAIDHYWTERITLLPDSTPPLFHGELLEGLPDLG